MIKKSVVSGLMLSTSVLGIAGCSVQQKEAVSNNAEHVTAKDPASEVTTKLASSVASRQENRPEQPCTDDTSADNLSRSLETRSC